MLSCPHCKASLPTNATFCSSCGHSMAGVAQAASSGGGARPGFSRDGMRICHGCGAIAPTERSSCAICQRPFSSLELRAPARLDGAYWAQIRTELTCRQCGKKSPIDEPDLDGTINCIHCSTMQAFDMDAWEEGFAHAHAVADLAGPSPEGRAPTPGASIVGKNPFVAIGITNTSATLELTGMSISGGVMRTRNLSIAVSPGHPLCKQCSTPIDAAVHGSRVNTRCPGCGDTAAYEVPREAQGLCRGLLLTIADEHRVDRPEARMNATSAGMVVALHCPSCGGAIEVQQGEHFTTCKFCKTSSRIPSRTLLSLKKHKEGATPWWALFSGPSPKRSELERAGEAKSSFASHVADIPKGSLEDPPVTLSDAEKYMQYAVGVVVPLAVFTVVGVILFLPIVWGWLHGFGSTTPPPPLPFP